MSRLPNRAAARITMLALALCAYVPMAQSQTELPLEDRVFRLERMLNTGSLVELLDRVQALQRELQELRGEVEVQAHELSQLKQRQRDLYLDLDRRLSEMKSAGVAPPPAAPPDPTRTEPDDSVTGTGEELGGEAQDIADPIKEQDAYQAAFTLLRTQRYKDAVVALQGFLGEYPDGNYASRAQYFLGEANYIMREYEPAVSAYQKLVDGYPEHKKIPEVLYKIGFIHGELGRKDQARKVLDNLIKRYPNTTAAELARERLEAM